MKTTPTLLCALLALSSGLAQDTRQDRERIRQERLETILRLQDLRAPSDRELVDLLSDEDPLVRQRATLAYGSLQDSSMISLLTRNLTGDDAGTATAAAFALGQTGIRLSEQGRRALESEIIWHRLEHTPAAARMIEEIGKFGTSQGLVDLMVRFGNTSPVMYPHSLIMSIARFAIRGITTTDAVRFLLGYMRDPVVTPWQAVYALQRIGNHPETREEIEALLRLDRHKDALVRMNLATLLGKLPATAGSVETLRQMAGRDADWRVRVNALRALGALRWKEPRSLIDTFRRAFSDTNSHVQCTALTVFPDIGVGMADTSKEAREALRQLAHIADNPSGSNPWPVQVEASVALSRLDGHCPRGLGRVDLHPPFRARLVKALGASLDSAARGILFRAAQDQASQVACASLEGLQTMAHRVPSDRSFIDSVWSVAIGHLATHDMAMVATSAAVLGDSLFLRRASVKPLLETLGALHPPIDTEAMLEAISTLGKIRDSSALPRLTELLQSVDPAVAAAAASALTAWTGNDYTKNIQRKARPLSTDLDFEFLRSLPTVTRIRLETSRGDILIDLNKDVAPFTVMSVLKLATQRGFYRGLTFHRVVPNFVVQGGDPRGDGWGGPGYALRSEFSMQPYETGTVGIASAGKDTEGSQFFITHSPQLHLDGRYTVIGQVVDGMDIVDKLQVDDRIRDITIVR